MDKLLVLFHYANPKIYNAYYTSSNFKEYETSNADWSYQYLEIKTQFILGCFGLLNVSFRLETITGV